MTKNKVASNIYKESDTKYKCMQFWGMIDDGGGKLYSKPSLVHQKDYTEINYNRTEHTKAIQRSNFLCVDDKLDKSYYLGIPTPQEKADDNKLGFETKKANEDNILSVGLKFCKQAEVNTKR
jgi:hypothetical protein